MWGCWSRGMWTWVFFFFRQKTAYEMRISDWSSDVCSSDLCAMQKGVKDRALVPDQVVRRIMADMCAQRVLSSRTPQCPVPGSAFQQRREYDCGVPPCSVHVPLKPDPQRYCAQCRPWPLS